MEPSTHTIPPPEQHPMEELQRIVRRVRRRLFVVPIVLVIAVVAAIVHTSRRPRLYDARVTLLVDSRPPRVVSTATEVNPEEQMADRDRFMNSLIRVIESQSISDQVERRLGLRSGTLAGAVMAKAEKNSYVLTLSVAHLDPKQAAEQVRAFATVFIESSATDRAGVAADAARFLDDEARSQRGAVELAEKAVYDFHRQNALPGSNFDESHKIASSTLEALHAQAAAARVEGIKLQAQRKELEAAKDHPNLQRALLAARSRSDERSAADRRDVLTEQLQQLETRYGVRHPKVVETRHAIEAVSTELDQELETEMAAVEARVRANQNEQAQLAGALSAETRKAVTLRQKELEYNQLKRKLDEEREAYEAVARRQHEIELQALAKQGYVRWLEGPRAATPIPHDYPRKIAFALLVGLLLGIGLAYGVDLLDDRIKSPLEGERELSPAMLGVLMSVSLREDAADRGVSTGEHLLCNPRSVVAEQCHSLATQIHAQFLERRPQSLMIVSPAVEDGKTTVAVNLAVTFASRGKRVLLVDSDLRCGRLHSLFGTTRSGGLYELVTQQATLAETARQTFCPGLDLVTTGDVPDTLSPVRIFEHRDLATVVSEMKEAYDLILFDTPPLLLVSDALLMADIVDGAVGVARAKKTSREMARRAAQHAIGGRINFLGWVLNDVSEAELRGKYYDRYGYGRAYGYARETSYEVG